VTALTGSDVRTGHDCYRVARADGLVPALEMLTGALLPGMVPFGPAGHAVTTPTVAAAASHAWYDGVRLAREAGTERILTVAAVPGGAVTILRRAAPAEPGERYATPHESWLSGLAWLRLGWSEKLRTSCTAYLGGRRAGTNATLLQQQLVKGSIADAVAAHLEVHAVLRDPDAVRSAGMADRLHRLLTAADRELVRLLGASGYVTGGEGQAANLSELVADAYCRAETAC
jgi:hypothetical protein